MCRVAAHQCVCWPSGVSGAWRVSTAELYKYLHGIGPVGITKDEVAWVVQDTENPVLYGIRVCGFVSVSCTRRIVEKTSGKRDKRPRVWPETSK